MTVEEAAAGTTCEKINSRGRVLDPSEIAFAGIRSTVGYSLFGTGQIDSEALSTAFAALQRSYPVLAGRIIAVGDGEYVLALSPPGAAPSRVGAGSANEPPIGEDGVVAEGEVCAVELIQQGNEFRMTLLTHHSIADGMASLRYLEALCTLYTEVIETGTPGSVTVHAMPKSVEQIFAEYGIDKQPLAPYKGSFDVAALPPLPKAVRSCPKASCSRVRLSTEQATKLLERAKHYGLTVHGIISTAVLLAGYDVAGASGPTPLTVMSAVDLRTRLTPAVEAEGGTNVVGFDSATVLVDPHGDVYALGRMVLDSIATNVANGVIHQALLHQPEMREQTYHLLEQGYSAVRAAAVMLTNWGRVPKLLLPSGVEAIDFRGSFGAVMSDPRSAVKLTGGAPNVIASTFNGRLGLDVQTWTTDDTNPTLEQADALQRAFNRLVG